MRPVSVSSHTRRLSDTSKKHGRFCDGRGVDFSPVEGESVSDRNHAGRNERPKDERGSIQVVRQGEDLSLDAAKEVMLVPYDGESRGARATSNEARGENPCERMAMRSFLRESAHLDLVWGSLPAAISSPRGHCGRRGHAQLLGSEGTIEVVR